MKIFYHHQRNLYAHLILISVSSFVVYFPYGAGLHQRNLVVIWKSRLRDHLSYHYHYLKDDYYQTPTVIYHDDL